MRVADAATVISRLAAAVAVTLLFALSAHAAPPQSRVSIRDLLVSLPPETPAATAMTTVDLDGSGRRAVAILVGDGSQLVIARLDGTTVTTEIVKVRLPSRVRSERIAAAAFGSSGREQLVFVSGDWRDLFLVERLGSGELALLDIRRIESRSPEPLRIVPAFQRDGRFHSLSVSLQRERAHDRAWVLTGSHADLLSYQPEGPYDDILVFWDLTGDETADAVVYDRHLQALRIVDSQKKESYLWGALPSAFKLEASVTGNFGGGRSYGAFLRSTGVHGGWYCSDATDTIPCAPVATELGSAAAVAKLAAGDLDGDGVDEIVGVGDNRLVIGFIHFEKREESFASEGVCIAAHPRREETDFGRVTRGCPDGHVAIEVDDNPGLLFVTCCPLPEPKMLTGPVIEASTACPDGSVVVGMSEWRPGKIPRLHCRRIDPSLGTISRSEPGMYWGTGLSMRRYTDGIDRTQIPLSIRVGVGRQRRDQWDADGCIGRPPGAVLVARDGPTCGGARFAVVTPHKNPLPVAGLFADCAELPNPFEEGGGCGVISRFGFGDRRNREVTRP